MAHTLFKITLTTLLAILGSVSAAQNYVVSYGNEYHGNFCIAWRQQAVSYAERTCHHHETSCVDDPSQHRATVSAIMVPFRNNPPGQCNWQNGPDNSIVTPIVTEVAAMAGATFVNGAPAGAPAHAPAPAPALTRPRPQRPAPKKAAAPKKKIVAMAEVAEPERPNYSEEWKATHQAEIEHYDHQMELRKQAIEKMEWNKAHQHH